MKKSVHILLTVCAALPVSVWALPADPALQCTLLKDNTLRLACFDKVYAAQFPPQNLPEAAKSKPKTVDLVKTIEGSIEQQKPTVVFDYKEDVAAAGYEPTQALLDMADAYTPLSRLYDLDENSPEGILSVREHNPMYLMPLWYNSSPNYYPSSPTRGVTDDDKYSDQKRLEAKMQVSFKSKLAEDLFSTRSDLWFGYTQISNWQVWNQGKESAPFRNNDYTPEIFITQPVKADLPLGGKLRMLGAGFAHQSNGQSRPSSRSWNRVYAMAGMEWGKLTVIPRFWVRAFDQSGEDDDNPDISDYIPPPQNAYPPRKSVIQQYDPFLDASCPPQVRQPIINAAFALITCRFPAIVFARVIMPPQGDDNARLNQWYSGFRQLTFAVHRLIALAGYTTRFYYRAWRVRDSPPRYAIQIPWAFGIYARFLHWQFLALTFLTNQWFDQTMLYHCQGGFYP